MITNPVKAIRAKCLDCCCGSPKEVDLCPCPDCALYPFRFGKNPYRAPRHYSPEQLEAMTARLSRFSPTTSGEKNDSATVVGTYPPGIQTDAITQQEQ